MLTSEHVWSGDMLTSDPSWQSANPSGRPGVQVWLVKRPRRQSIPALGSGGLERKGLLLHRCRSIC